MQSAAQSAREAGEEAAKQFKGGLYCAESVLVSLAKYQGITSDLLPAIATGFCGGLSRTQGPCGALTGAVMALGLAYGRDRGDQGVDQAYAAVQALTARFVAEFGSRDCAELLGCDLGTEDGQQKFRRESLHEHCFAFSRRAAELGAELLDQAVPPPSAPCSGCGPD